MTLSTRLRGVDLVLKCKYCGHPKIKKGAWFMTVHHFECEGCKSDVPVTYSDKVELFAEHAHLAKDEGDNMRQRGNLTR
jgi:hypothetical protein